MAKITVTNETNEYQIVDAHKPVILNTLPTYEECQKWGQENGVTSGQAWILKPQDTIAFYIEDKPGQILTALGWMSF